MDPSGTPRVDRLSAADLTSLATDHGPVPMQIGALLHLGPSGAGASDAGPRGAGPGGDASGRDVPGDAGRVLDVLRARVLAVPRLGQRLRQAPPLLGRPYWESDPHFRPEDHVAPVEATAGRGPLAVLSDLLCTRLDPARPLWRAVLVTGLPDGGSALAIVMHHVLADGLGGLAVLAALADPGPAPAPAPPRSRTPATSRRALVHDVLRSRLQTLRGLPSAARRAGAGVAELGLVRAAPRLVPRNDLNRPTGGRRVLHHVELPLADVVATAHGAGGTVNDVVLTAASGAVLAALDRRGQLPPELVVSVPVSSRGATRADRLGNAVGVRPVAVPGVLGHRVRLAAVVAEGARARSAPAPGRGSSAAPMGAVFRLLGRMRVFQAFIDRQRLVHTFESNLRGPATPLSLAGRPVLRVVPGSVQPGNVGVSFTALSYAGVLGVTVVADPVVVPDHDRVAADLAGALAALTFALPRLDPGR